MSSHLRLPPTLLDLVLARATARLDCLTSHSVRRNYLYASTARRLLHQNAYATEPPSVQYVPENAPHKYASREQTHSRDRTMLSAGMISRHRSALSQLEDRVKELKELAAIEEPISDVPAYTEAELLSVYEDLLAIPASERDGPDTVQGREDTLVLQRIVNQLFELDDPSSVPSGIRNQYNVALSRLREIVQALQVTQTPILPDRTSSGKPTSVAVEIMKVEEWSSLVRICVQEQDGPAAEEVLDLMKRAGAVPPDESVSEVMALYANVGDVLNTERFLKKFAGPKPAEAQRDLHIKSYLKVASPDEMPTTALSLLHAYEARALPAPQRSYTRVIGFLLTVRSAAAEAHAWDLFAHMRYPGSPAQPERALDLWTEMTIDKRIAPTATAYSAVILACARSGTHEYVHEAFRLAKEMLDAHRDAYGQSAFHPDRAMYRALLEGAKRVGDLAKTRWILAEMVSAGRSVDGAGLDEAVVVDEEIMMHVFHAYAAYRPPFKRSATVIVDKEPPPPNESATTERQSPSENDVPCEQAPVAAAEAQGEGEQAGPIVADTRSTYYDGMPQGGGADFDLYKRFYHVSLTPRLLNSYLSVHYAHSSFDTWTHLFRTLFAELGVPRIARSYVEALERCAVTRRGPERALALKFAEEIWPGWQSAEESWLRRDMSDMAQTVDARLVERAHAAMIRILSLNGKVRRAVEHLRSFIQCYPPGVVKAARAVDSTVEIPDDTVPPFLTFPELEILHHRLVAESDRAGIRFLKWVCMSYEGALRRRRDDTLHARPVPNAAPVPV
ncbi:hypothetical protein A0H81_05466 [Grifola frondosa]|uniref:Uncharacterized protein n=1 Tax=Grifola frondosa TaxID=5627 RepID=A0A1C7MDZ9_GRIFR|nr:hypothetical protein A0H81_05466 [Grifola frondosa]